jgi:hypothetical protein
MLPATREGKHMFNEGLTRQSALRNLTNRQKKSRGKRLSGV